MRPRYSQNFLIRTDIAQDIVKALELSPQDRVLEIGPGRGILTEILIQSKAKISAVEIDRDLFNILSYKWKTSLALVNQDFLDADLDRLFPEPGPVKVVGNLPYAVTSPILQKVLSWPRWSTAVFMVQKEVGERLKARPGTKDYGVLTVSVQSRASADKILDVPASAFKPAPKVQSSVLKLTPLPNPAFDPSQETIFFKAVKGCFAHRRKMAANSLAQALGIETPEAREALKRADLDPTARGEDYSIADFVRLARVLYNNSDAT
jgi:16S rRNA (adenine1518-N6/adenine1519-N6)-dimethyltransferase